MSLKFINFDFVGYIVDSLISILLRFGRFIDLFFCANYYTTDSSCLSSRSFRIWYLHSRAPKYVHVGCNLTL